MWFGGGGGGNDSAHQHQKTTVNSVQVNLQPATEQMTTASEQSLLSPASKPTGGHGAEPSGSGQQSPAADLVSLSASSNTITVQHTNNFQVERPEKISFHLKTSIFTRRVTVDTDKMALGMIKQLAVSFLNELYFQHQFPSNTYIGSYIRKHFSNNDNINELFDRLSLKKYLPDQEVYVPFNLVSDIEPESLISIEVAERVPSHQEQHHGHQLASQASAGLQGQQQQPLKISHEFKPESFILPAYCASCSTLIKGVFRQGYQCSFCKKNYCPKCKTRAEASDEACLAPIQVTNPSGSQVNSGRSAKEQLQLAASSNDTGLTAADSYSSSHQKSGSTSGNCGAGAQNSSRLEVLGVSMSKRKSASNLLLFNLANPFKSHHAQNQPTGKEEGKLSKARGSAGALEPGDLRASSKQKRDSTDQNNASIMTPTDCCEPNANNLMVAQTNHISSSHQNLFTDTSEQRTREHALQSIADDQRLTLTTSGVEILSSSGNSSVFQSSSGSSTGKNQQLSNSAATSTLDLHLGPAQQMKRDQANHTFISMEWIQLSGEPLCGVCKKVLRSSRMGRHHQQQVALAPFMCKSCKLQVHAQCQNLVLTDCMSRIAESSRAAAAAGVSQEASGGSDSQRSNLKGTVSNVSRDNIRLHRLSPSVKHTKRPDSTVPIIEGWLKHTTLSDEKARQHYWRLDQTDLTLYENDHSTRYFKAIALSKITRVMSASSLPKRVREDVLTGGQLSSPQKKGATPKSANTSPTKSAELLAQMGAMFAFELTSGSMYLVQANSQDEAGKWKESLAAATTSQRVSPAKEAPIRRTPPGTPDKLCSSADKVDLIKMDQEPVSPVPVAEVSDPSKPVADEKTINLPANLDKRTDESQTPQPRPLQQQPQVLMQRQQQHHHHHPPTGGANHPHHRGTAHKAYTDPNRSRLYNRPRITIKLDPMSVPDHLIAGKYLIERDRVKGVGFEELGSGQFGKVYAAISEYKKEDAKKGEWSGVPVAIKEISKARFDLRQQAKLKNEANILSHLDHPGVIILERVHDLPDKIFIVMEQLEDDMLEMIVSTQEKRLNERITKFLTYQILEALKYLHGKNIAHCDLKPENVLLVERRSQFPQIKLCDFGFAKIIEENSFRSSLVGTPAYLAPEVVKGERYNRSVDLWSVGVIVYVSLSGEFPFNEGENIHDQISRANFMYPDQPWAKISTQAKEFINSLLRVNCERRLSSYKAQMNEWLQDFQLWCDLCELEIRVGRRWVTDDADYSRWSEYAKKHKLQIPRSAIQLHEELDAD